MSEINDLRARYDDYKARNLKLNMSRGRPCKEQLDLSSGIMTVLPENDYKSINGDDCRNYGGIEGIIEARELLAPLLDVTPEEIIAGGNSSLNMMYDTISRAMSHGVLGSDKPWNKYEKVKFICPSPGYDRHFAITEFFGVEMITVPMTHDGPDMDAVEALAASDETVKGIWCVPLYSNPDGISYSDNTVERFATMKTAAKDFRIMWDNAYAIHHLYEQHDAIKNILRLCEAAGNPDRVFMFASTSKVTFPGAGVAVMGASKANIKHTLKQMAFQTICPDKVNQLRHVRYFQNFENIKAHMKKHAEILRPKFALVDEIFTNELGGREIARWNKPNGGYFISLFTKPGKASRVIKLVTEAGLVLSTVGSTYPYGKDPNDSNIRIAPTLPPAEELKTAMELLSTVVKLVSYE